MPVRVGYACATDAWGMLGWVNGDRLGGEGRESMKLRRLDI